MAKVDPVYSEDGDKTLAMLQHTHTHTQSEQQWNADGREQKRMGK